jgi:hypothetical protein
MHKLKDNYLSILQELETAMVQTNKKSKQKNETKYFVYLKESFLFVILEDL